MATLTFTEMEQTKSDSSFITSESNATKQNPRVKNKNAVLRKSKSAQNGENLDNPKKSQMNEEPHEIKTQLSRPEFDGEDSAIGSEVNSIIGMPFVDDPLQNENDGLLNDLDNLILQPAGTTSNQFRIQKRSDFPSPTSRILSGQPSFIVPKLPIARTSAVPTGNSTPQKGIFQRNGIQPVDKVPHSIAFQTKCLAVSNNLETSDVQIDGEQSLTTKLPSHCGIGVTSIPFCSEGIKPTLRKNPVAPKFPVPQTRAVRTGHCTTQKGKYQHYRIQPVDRVPHNNAFQTECLAVSNNLETSDVRIDGEQSLTTKLQSSYSTEALSLPSCSRGGMSDFVILHTDADMEEACAFMTHLVNDTGIENLTVDLFSNIDAGKPGMQSLGKLHEKYRYILTYVTDNLASDKYCRFLQEILLTFGLQEANGKEDRVVPVFTKNERCKILEISIIRGLQYFKFRPLNTFLSNLYLKSVRNLVQDGRTKFP